MIRADASTEIGTGHAMRMLALTEALRDGGHRVTVASVATTPAIAARFEAEGADLTAVDGAIASADDAAETSRIASAVAADRLVLDGYRFDAAYLHALPGDIRRLVIDDGGVVAVDPEDLVLDQNLGADPRRFAGRPSHRTLVGPRYALLRREFAKRWATGGAAGQRAPDALARILVTMGGADRHDVTRMALEGLSTLEGRRMEVRAVIGSSHPDPRGIEALARRSGFETVLDATSFADELAWADLIVGGCGTSALEYACVGRPAVGVVLADNQRPVAAAIAAQGLGVVAGEVGSIDAERLASVVASCLADRAALLEMAGRGPRMVDGRGAARVVRALAHPDLALRPAAMADAERLWAWANDPEARRWSIRTDPIPWDEHVAWLAAKLADPRSSIAIAEEAGSPVANVRLESAADRAVISIAVANDARGRGIGTRVLDLAVDAARSRAVPAIDAFIKPDNAVSIAAFESAGFRPVTDADLPAPGLLAYRLPFDTP